jgi:thiamine-monophosphate kinase
MGGKSWREPDVIRLFSGLSNKDNKSLIKGIGDDCAVIRPSAEYDWVVTTDMLVEGTHFDSSFHPAYLLGRKSMAVNISDIAAMGGSPQIAFLSIAVPRDITTDWLSSFSDGIRSLLTEFNISLAGGDTVQGSLLTINVTLFGTVPQSGAMMRSGAGEGDTIFVSGNLGSAAAGLRICQNQTLRSLLDERLVAPFIKRHLDPSPDVSCGKVLAESSLVTAMQDISDGLATDLAHLCSESGVGAEIQTSRLPCHDDLHQVCTALGCQTLDLQISGGEDYHLVFTVKAGKEEELLRYLSGKIKQDIYPVGKIIVGSGVSLIDGESRKDITFQGYSHSGTG